MFRTTCDNRVTTSAARQPTNSKPAHPEMPAGKPDMHQTRPLESCALPHHRAPAAHRNPSRPPFHRHPHPCGTGRVLALSQLATLEPAALNISARPPGLPTIDRM